MPHQPSEEGVLGVTRHPALTLRSLTQAETTRRYRTFQKCLAGNP